MAGIYIHIPFCKQKCHYCSFHFSTTYEKYRVRMINAILTEIKQEANSHQLPIDTIYFGGGTPSLLSKEELSKILFAVKKNYDVGQQAEITLESNPDDITFEIASSWFEIGINRLSIGIQSFFNDDLKMMNRAHDSNQASKAIQLIKEAGFTNYSVDLMFALPQLSNENWIANLNKLIELKVPHLSCYNLTIEEQSAVVKLIKQGTIPKLSESKSLEQFDLLMDIMSTAGYEQYEISNFSLPGYHSKHNSAYWNQIPYIGFGPSAHSLSNGKRYFNIPNNSLYMDGIEKNKNIKELESLSEENKFNEYVLTKLRCSDGISCSYLQKHYPSFYQKIIAKIRLQEKHNYVTIIQDNVVLTKKGRFIADQIAMDLFM